MNAAKALNDQQSRYDLLHHRKRAADILRQQEKGRHLTHFDRQLLRDSQTIIANPALGSHSVDLDDLAYLAELDATDNAAEEATSDH